MDEVILDGYQRPLRNLRLSVTDRCNLRCSYCMPEPEYVWLPREDILQFEEIETLVDIFTSLGVDKVRLTGGEPLLRRDLPELIQKLAARPAIRDLAMTTNGVLLAAQAKALRDAGLHRLTVSLDTLRPDRFRQLTRFDELDRVLDGIATAAPLFRGLKLDAVIIRGVNEDELVDLVEFARRHEAEVRFIEYMDVGGATHWSLPRVVSRREMLEVLASHYGPINPVIEESSAPADRYTLAGRDDLRNHLFDHRAILRELRSQSADGRWTLVSLPLRRTRHRPAPATQGRGECRTSRSVDSRDVGGAKRSRRRRAPRVTRPVAVDPGRSSPPRPASGDAHAGRIDDGESTPKLQLPTSKQTVADLVVGSWELT